LRQPIAVIPNGVHVPEKLTAPAVQSERIALFVSRIHPKKGLLNLVEAWRIVRPEGWRMIIAGPDEGGHQSEVLSAIRAAGLERKFAFIGAVEGEEKWTLFRQASLFILPTFSENFGVAVAEALACGVPVITTKGAPWSSLSTQQCGWWIDIGVDPLAAALRTATQAEPEMLSRMGDRGRTWAARAFTWKAIAGEMRAVYEWVLRGGTVPPSIQIA
jgi:glycosyltransferase involved in cell wall biosynthesis